MANYSKGRQSYPEWSEAELLTLYRLFATATWPELLAALPGRTRGAIWQKGKIVEKLVRKINRKVPWTKRDDDILRSNYATASDAELHRLLPKHTHIAIQRRGSELKIYRVRPEARSHSRVVLPIIKRLYEARLAKHMRRPELAAKLGYAHGQILAWELGKTNPEFRVVIDWAQALGFEIELRDPKEVATIAVENIVPLPKPKIISHGDRDALLDRIAELEEVLGKREVCFDYARVKLTPSEAEFVGLFMKRGYWTKESLYTVLYSARHDAAPDPKILDVLMVKIRRKLAPFEITIETQTGTGWSMTAENRAKLNGLLISNDPQEAMAG